MLLAALMLAAASPSAEALALGRQVAEGGMLAAMMPLLMERDIEELLAANAELSANDKARLRATAETVGAAGRERVLAAMGRAYAENMTAEDLRTLAAFQRTPAARSWRGAEPAVVAATMRGVGSFDFKKDVREAFCRETGKLCAAK